MAQPTGLIGATNPLNQTANPLNQTAYKPAAAKTTEWKVDRPQTVQGQMAQITKQNNPLQQLATTSALQGVAKNGLLNSSMAIGAAQNAVLQSALPIATADANTYAASGQFNADAQNTGAQFNANSQNAASQFNIGTGQKAREFDITTANQNRQFNVSTKEGMREFNVNKNEAARQFDVTSGEAARQFDAAELNKLNMNQLSEDNKVKMNEFNAANAALINQNEGAATLYNTYQQAVNAILNNPDMDEANKQAAIQLQFESLQAGMAMYTGVANLNLGSILPPPPAAPPPTPPGGVGIQPPPPATPRDPNASGTTPPGSAPGSGGYSSVVNAAALAEAQKQWDDAVNNWQPNYNGDNGATIERERQAFLASLGPRPT